MLGGSNNLSRLKQQIMNKKLIEMKNKYGIIYQFMIEVLGLNENEALKNTLKLEGSISENALNRLKCFIEHTKDRILNDPEYSKEFSRYFIK